MKKTAATGIALAALILAACSDDSDGETTAPTEDPTVVTQEPEPTDDPTEDPTDDPTEEPPEPTDDPTVEDQRAEAVPFDTDVDLSPTNEVPAIITWQTPGETLHVYTQGSSTSGCYPAPIDAWTDGEMIEIAFNPPQVDAMCTADVVTHAWEITWDEPFEVSGPMDLVLSDILGMGQSFDDLELPPIPTEPLA